MNSKQKAETVLLILDTLEPEDLSKIEAEVQRIKIQREKASKDLNGKFRSTETL